MTKSRQLQAILHALCRFTGLSNRVSGSATDLYATTVNGHLSEDYELNRVDDIVWIGDDPFLIIISTGNLYSYNYESNINGLPSNL